MPLKPLQYLSRLGNQAGGEEVTANWGNPRLSGGFSEESPGFRMALPQWAPGEFEEWKQAKVMGIPTTYGWNKQQEFSQRKTPGLIDHIRQGADNANRVQAGMVGPAFANLLKGIR